MMIEKKLTIEKDHSGTLFPMERVTQESFEKFAALHFFAKGKPSGVKCFEP